ncbi:hypothetical protein Pelo_14260 [Pelomyxa schiedti]|nr:hypothetical protein Pelo_14260 [Pelomyxa schiedti]
MKGGRVVAVVVVILVSLWLCGCHAEATNTLTDEPTVKQTTQASDSVCPAGTCEATETCCPSQMCCPKPDACCCPDQTHCCPNGYQCYCTPEKGCTQCVLTDGQCLNLTASK